MPATCPVCGSELRRDAEEVVWRCENPSCPARLRRSLEHFASRVGHEHRGAGRVAGRSAHLARARPRLRGPLSPDRRAARAAGRHAAGAAIGPRRAAEAGQGRAKRHRADRSEPIERSLAADLRARHPARRREGRGDARAPFPDDGPRPRRADRGAAVGAGHRPGRRRIGPRVRRRAAESRSGGAFDAPPASTWRARRRKPATRPARSRARCSC